MQFESLLIQAAESKCRHVSDFGGEDLRNPKSAQRVNPLTVFLSGLVCATMIRAQRTCQCSWVFVCFTWVAEPFSLGQCVYSITYLVDWYITFVAKYDLVAFINITILTNRANNIILQEIE